jgi:putative ABC transport system permease protein
MLLRLLFKSIQRRRSRMALAILAVVMGASIATAMLTVSFDINEKMGKELRSYGANIVLLPKSQVTQNGVERQTYLAEKELYKMKTIFWRNNIVGYAPYLSKVVDIDGKKITLTGTYFEEEIEVSGFKKVFVGGRTGEEEAGVFKTGVKEISPWWQVEGNWPGRGEALVGILAAEKLGVGQGEVFTVKYRGEESSFKVSGILSTGGSEDDEVFISLGEAQALFDRPGAVDRVVVSALTKPEPEGGMDPQKLTPEEFEAWYCTPYISSIMFQLEEVIPDGAARPIRQVAENEGKLLKKFETMMFLITFIALASASLGVMATMMTVIFERRHEIGLMKAIGADDTQISQMFFAEAVVIGITGGGLGIIVGTGLARMLGIGVFGAVINPSSIAVAVALSLSVMVALLGSLIPVKDAIKTKSAITLKEG